MLNGNYHFHFNVTESKRAHILQIFILIHSHILNLDLEMFFCSLQNVL